MNTLNVEAELAKKYKYKPLPKDLSEKYRKWYVANIPSFLKLNGDDRPLFTLKGTILCPGYDRIVVGDYGAFIEYSETCPSAPYIIAPGQEYRVNDPRYSNTVKYVWLTAKDDSGVKIYKQNRGVSYADYKPGKYYVSVHEVLVMDQI